MSKLQVKIEVEGGCVTDVWVTDSDGKDVPFEYEVDDKDLEQNGDEGELDPDYSEDGKWKDKDDSSDTENSGT